MKNRSIIVPFVSQSSLDSVILQPSDFTRFKPTLKSIHLFDQFRRARKMTAFQQTSRVGSFLAATSGCTGCLMTCR